VGKSLVIGRVRGIEIKVHPTFLLVVPWVAFHWGYSGGYGLVGALFGVVLTALLFAFVVLHELGHSFAALRYGVGVRDITLLPIGGVARIEQLPVDPRREIVIALAGPAVNLLIGLLLLPSVLLITYARGAENPLELLVLLTDLSLSSFVVYLFATNVLLVAFNLLPAFPMDGGRVLRAVLSYFAGRLTATRVAVLLGQALGSVLCVVGLVTWGPSLILVGLFIIAAAYVEATAVRVEHTMRKLRVGQFILWDMGGVGEHHPLTYALRGGPRDVAVVSADGRVVGMLWRHDLMQALNGGASRFRAVGELMDAEAVVADVDDTIYEVHRRMLASGRRALPVTEHGYYRGIFTSDRFWNVYGHVARRPWLELRARLLRLALARRVRFSGR
jgi:Zn-dependent protease